MSQPTLASDKGVILTVGFIDMAVNRGQIVLPVATDSAAFIDVIGCKLAVDAFVEHIVPLLLDCMSSDGAIRFVQAEGMDDGIVPWRHDITGTDGLGTGGNGGIPSNAGLLCTFYEEPLDTAPGERMRTAHNNIGNVPSEQWLEGTPSGPLLAAGQALIDVLVAGWLFEPAIGSDKWYRVLAAKKRGIGGDPPATNLKRICAGLPRGYAGTTRRRQVPQ